MQAVKIPGPTCQPLMPRLTQNVTSTCPHLCLTWRLMRLRALQVVHADTAGRLAVGVLLLRAKNRRRRPAQRVALAERGGSRARRLLRRAAGGAAAGAARPDVQGARVAARQRASIQGASPRWLALCLAMLHHADQDCIVSQQWLAKSHKSAPVARRRCADVYGDVDAALLFMLPPGHVWPAPPVRH